jgi:enoyl-CoA hydratase / 3-hydroxyacyl-CoA dehydrogenase
MTIQKAAVVGAGNMGSGIAQKIATEGFNVILADMNEEQARKGVKRIETLLMEGVERKIFKPEQVETILGRISATGDMNDLNDVDIIIEAVFEDIGIKQSLFQKLGEITRPDTVLATNTSSFLVAQVAEGVQHPERVIGLHYFYHPAKNRLVEVIGHEATSESVLADAWNFQERIGKTPIDSADAPGFVVNRFFVPWLNEAIRLKEEGHSIASIEAASKQCFGVGMGPFELMNVTGVPITLHASHSLAGVLGDFYAPAASLVPQVESGENWNLGGEPDEASIKPVSERLLGVVFTIAGHLVDEGVSTLEDTDIGARVGLRWPIGPFELANQIGKAVATQHVKSLTEKYNLDFPECFAGPDPFVLSRVSLDVEDSIATIMINRPDKLNALDPETVSQLGERFEEAQEDKSVDGIVIAGAGKAFVAGADVQFFVDKIRGDSLDKIQAFTEKGQAIFRAIEKSPKRVICAMDGLALGGGAELALSCHAIVATNRASMGFPETGIGIYPGLGGTQRLTRRLGLGLARYYIYTGAFLSSKDLARLNLADEVVGVEELDDAIARALKTDKVQTAAELSNLDEPTREVAQWLAETSSNDLLKGQATEPESAKALKILKKVSFKAPLAIGMVEELTAIASEKDLDEGLSAELAKLKSIFGSSDALEGLSALLERRRPNYQGV